VIISFRLEHMDMLVTLPARRLRISGRMCGLPVTNIRVEIVGVVEPANREP